MPCHTFLYVRKSTDEDDRQTLSLDAQEKECRAFAAGRGLEVAELVRESHSARRPGRPLFEQMLQRVAALAAQGRKVAILSHKPDRLLRNLADWAKLNDLIDAGVDLLFVTGSYPNNAQGKMAFGVNVLFAKYYVDNLSEEVHKGIREKIARGEWPAWAPLGYLNVRDKAAPERVVVDPAVAPLVRRAFEHYATGDYSLASLAAKLEAEGLVGRTKRKRLTPGYLQDRILRNPFYCGLMRFRGQLHPGVHQPLVPVSLFERVQERMREAGKPRPKRHAFRYRGIFKCARCGGAVVGDLKKGKYLYYRCSHHRGPCDERYLREEELEMLLRRRVREQVALRPAAVEMLREAAERVAGSGGQDADTERQALQRQAATADRRLAALLDLRLEGSVSEGEYAQKRAELVLARARAQEGLRTFELPGMDPREAVSRYVSFFEASDAVFDRGEDTDIRELLRIVGSNYRIGGRDVHFEPVEPFTMAAQARNHPQWCPSEEDVLKIVAFVQSADAGSMSTS